MSDLVPTEDIERIVGIDRHPTAHFGRAVSSEQMIYILHPQECLDSGMDLRECPYSIALDRGILAASWADHEDVPVKVWVSGGSGRLVPLDTLTPRNLT